MKATVIISILILTFIQNAQSLNDTDFSLSSVACKFISQSNKMFCKSSLGNLTCDTLSENIPFNFTEYAIGEMKATGGPNPMIWFRLYPRKLDNSGWWYYRSIKLDYMKLSIHSTDKDSKSDGGFLVTNQVCWNKMNLIIRASNSYDTIKAEKYNKGVLTKPYHKTKMIGVLEISN